MPDALWPVRGRLKADFLTTFVRFSYFSFPVDVGEAGVDLPILRSGGNRLRRSLPSLEQAGGHRAGPLRACRSGTSASRVPSRQTLHRLDLERRHRPDLSFAFGWPRSRPASARWLPWLAHPPTLSPSRWERQTPAGRLGGRGHDRVGLSGRYDEGRMPATQPSVCGKSRFYVTGARRDT